MIAVGLGFTNKATADDIVTAIDATLAAYRMKRKDVDVISTAVFKRGSQSFLDAATRINLQPRYYSRQALSQYNDRLQIQSEHSLTSTGIACVCEAAALSATGKNGVLLGPRRVHGLVTCAVAEAKR